MTSRALRLSSALLAAALFLTSCGGGDGGEGEDEASPSASQTNEDGTTAAGTTLEFGEPATITWQPRKNLEGTVEVTVQRVRLAPRRDLAGFKLPKSLRNADPYYVQVRAENAGETNLSGVQLPIFMDNGTDVLFPPAKFSSSFKPCSGRNLPKKFVAGKTARLCLVFLADQGTRLEAVALRADEDEQTINWTGEVTKPGGGKKKQKQGNKKQGNKQQN